MGLFFCTINRTMICHFVILLGKIVKWKNWFQFKNNTIFGFQMVQPKRSNAGIDESDEKIRWEKYENTGTGNLAQNQKNNKKDLFLLVTPTCELVQSICELLRFSLDDKNSSTTFFLLVQVNESILDSLFHSISIPFHSIPFHFYFLFQFLINFNIIIQFQANSWKMKTVNFIFFVLSLVLISLKREFVFSRNLLNLICRSKFKFFFVWCRNSNLCLRVE